MTTNRLVLTFAAFLIFAASAGSSGSANLTYQQKAQVLVYGEVNKSGALEFVEGMT